uniref:Uncharacterized protein n=1 Tax=viral metagenome TaxID=1070528 RepID=A0A6C0L219_9ZZZZ|tara:strand:+ start:11193 stop:11444 length:252 start_codon:yes stop_codon:yes gene_type:complete
MITDIIRLLLFAIIIVAFICFYESDYIIKESMQTKETKDDEKLDSIESVKERDSLKNWLKKEGTELYNINSTSTKITDLISEN